MVEWNYFDKFDRVMNEFLPAQGEGETMATQIVTAVSKLVYKWYNDGDVFDNSGWLNGWCNDLSSYANWLRKHTNSKDILDRVYSCNEGEYEVLLKELADRLFDLEDLENMDKQEKVGSIYDCEGPYVFSYYEDDEEDYEDEYEEGWF